MEMQEEGAGSVILITGLVFRMVWGIKGFCLLASSWHLLDSLCFQHKQQGRCLGLLRHIHTLGQSPRKSL